MTNEEQRRYHSKGYSLPDGTVVRETYRLGETIISLYPPPGKVGGAGALMMVKQSFPRTNRGLEQKIES